MDPWCTPTRISNAILYFLVHFSLLSLFCRTLDDHHKLLTDSLIAVVNSGMTSILVFDHICLLQIHKCPISFPIPFQNLFLHVAENKHRVNCSAFWHKTKLIEMNKFFFLCTLSLMRVAITRSLGFQRNFPAWSICNCHVQEHLLFAYKWSLLFHSFFKSSGLCSSFKKLLSIVKSHSTPSSSKALIISAVIPNGPGALWLRICFIAFLISERLLSPSGSSTGSPCSSGSLGFYYFLKVELPSSLNKLFIRQQCFISVFDYVYWLFVLL